MNLETKIGAFVLIGLAVSAVGIMKLSDVRLEKRYTIYMVFKDVQSLREQSPIKIAGVEIGKVGKIELEQGRAKITAKISKDVPLYANARVKVNVTGLIGSQFVDLFPGTPEASQLKDGDTIYGLPTRSLNDLMEKLSELIDGKDGQPGLGDDLKATMSNLRNVTESLNAAIGQQRRELVDMVENLHAFSADLKGIASDMHEITSSKKADIEAAITKLRSILDRVDEIVAKIQKGEGPVGRLVSDKEMGDEVKKTVSNLKETSESAKEVLGRFTKIRSFWEFEARTAPGISTVRGDGGIRLQPRDKKYYYLGVNNAGDRKDEFKNEGDYEKKNTITALLGKEFGPFAIELGAVRSSAGANLKYHPFRDVIAEDSSQRWARNFELHASAFDFGRDEIRGRAGRERKFEKPHYNVGAKYKINRWVKLGASVEDLAEVRQVNVNTNLVFEDRDLAYLFGFVSFAR